MFRIEMLPAQQGDALWIEYGDPAAPSRVLVDTGTPPTYEILKRRICDLPPESRRLELLVVTHVDTDHLGAALPLLADRTLGLQVGEVWFNAWRHLLKVRSDRLGPIDGEILSVELDHAGWPWNQSFDHGPAVVMPGDAPLPSVTLPGGMVLTLLSPGPEQLANLKKEWKKVVTAAGLDPANSAKAEEILASLAAKKHIRLDLLGPEKINVEAFASTAFVPDEAPANGSAIALLAEYDGKSALLCGDGFPGVIATNVVRLLQKRGRRKLALDACKLPHHGSKHNVSNELLSLLSCSRYLFSTSGAIFGHPDREGVARVIVSGGAEPTLYFNYRSEINSVWDDQKLMRDHRYHVLYPAKDETGLAVDL